VQPDERVRIVEDADDPRMDGTDVDAEFFVQFAPQGVRDRLPRFELPARELPVPRVRLARGPAREQEAAVGPDQDADGDIDRRARRGHPRAGRAADSRCPAH